MKRSILTVALFCSAVSVSATETDAYIESAGVAGIDTGYRLKSSTRVELDFALVEMPSVSDTYKPRVFGADRNHAELVLTGSLFVDQSYYWRIHIGDGAAYKDHYLKEGSALHTCDTDRHVIVIDFPSGNFSMNVGSSVLTNVFDATIRIAEGSECTQTLALFARQLLNGGFELPSKTRIYGMKIYENDVSVRDFVPCVKDGIVGFKDMVGGGFVCNPAAEGSFSAGGDVLVEESAYVATPEGNNTDSAKHLYLDTGYYATENTSVELDYALVERYPAETNPTWYLISGMTRFCCYLNKNGVGFGVSSSWSSKTLAGSVSGTPGVRRTAILDQPGELCAVVTGGFTNEVLAIKNDGDYAKGNTIKIASNATVENYFASMKIYGCRIYESGTLVHDFRPFIIGPRQDGDVTVALKDSVTGILAIYPEATSSKRLACGGTMPVSVAPYVENLRSNGCFIDTGYMVKSTTKVELDYAPAENRADGDTWYLFWGKDDGIFAAFVNNNGFGFINTKDTWKQGIGKFCGPDLTGIRRTMTLDNPASTASVAIDGQVVASQEMTGSADWKFDRLSLKIGGAVNNSTGYASMRIYGCRIWEKEGADYVLKHQFVPSVNDGTAGLNDIIGDSFKTCNGLVYGGAFVPAVTPSSSKITVGKSIILSATAPGAKSYRWLKNGSPIVGGEGGTLEIAWKKGYALDSYQAISVIEVDGVKVESEPSKTVMVENLRAGTMVSIR